MIDHLIERRQEIYNCWINDEEFIESFNTEELFQLVVTFSKDLLILPLLIRDSDKILSRCTEDYDMFNYFTILSMKVNDINKVKSNESIERTVKKIFSKESIIFLMKQYKYMMDNGVISKEELFEKMINELKLMPTDKSSKILFDLYLFPDFHLMFRHKHRTIATLIESYHLLIQRLLVRKYLMVAQ